MNIKYLKLPLILFAILGHSCAYQQQHVGSYDTNVENSCSQLQEQNQINENRIKQLQDQNQHCNNKVTYLKKDINETIIFVEEHIQATQDMNDRKKSNERKEFLEALKNKLENIKKGL